MHSLDQGDYGVGQPSHLVTHVTEIFANMAQVSNIL